MFLMRPCSSYDEASAAFEKQHRITKKKHFDTQRASRTIITRPYFDMGEKMNNSLVFPKICDVPILNPNYRGAYTQFNRTKIMFVALVNVEIFELF